MICLTDCEVAFSHAIVLNKIIPRTLNMDRKPLTRSFDALVKNILFVRPCMGVTLPLEFLNKPVQHFSLAKVTGKRGIVRGE